jgi:hypothetical protein
VHANVKFVTVDVGAYGKQCNGGVTSCLHWRRSKSTNNLVDETIWQKDTCQN